MGARGPFAGVVASGQIHTYVICRGGESQDFSRVNERKRGAPLCKWYMNMPESKTARQPPHWQLTTSGVGAIVAGGPPPCVGKLAGCLVPA